MQKTLSDSIVSTLNTIQGGDNYISGVINTGKSNRGKIDNILIPLSVCTCTRVWGSKKCISYRKYERTYTFFGREKDVNSAIELFNIFKNYIDSEIDLYKKSDDYKNSKISPILKVNSFRTGLIHKIEDIIYMLRDQIDPVEYDARCVKLEIEFNKLGMRLLKHKSYSNSNTYREHAGKGSQRAEGLVKAINRDIKINKILSK